MNFINERMTVTILGAGGKMGSRITGNLLKKNYNLLLCDKGEAGIKKIIEKGLQPVENEKAVPVSDVVIMALPDSKIGEVSKVIVPIMKSGAILITLDPAAAYIGELVLRDDCTFVVTHPCHPPLFREQETKEAQRDYFGGIAAKQDIVIALLKGDEEKFRKAQAICEEMFAPVEKCYRITLDQMAFMEPAVVEVIGATCAYIMKQAVDEAVNYGVPQEVAESFLLGHIHVLLAIYFQKIPSSVSDACKIAVQYGTQSVFREDWKKVFQPETIRNVVNRMLHPEKYKIEGVN